MSGWTKKRIIEAALAGMELPGVAVASRSSTGRVLTMRHIWKDTEDGRVLDAVKRSYLRYAREQMVRLGKSVEVYSREGFMIAEMVP